MGTAYNSNPETDITHTCDFCVHMISV